MTEKGRVEASYTVQLKNPPCKFTALARNSGEPGQALKGMLLLKQRNVKGILLSSHLLVMLGASEVLLP